MAEIPLCQNWLKKRGCPGSDMLLIEGNEQGWSFYCKGCKAVQVVSADGVRDRSKFVLAETRKKQQEELNRRWASRKKVFI